MKHASRAAPVLILTLAVLAGCATPPGADDIRLTRRSETADDWSHHFPDLYRGLSACLAADPAPPAYALSVVPQNHGMMLVYLADHAGSKLACSIDTAATQKPKLIPATPLEDQALHGPRFTPASMAEPFLVCGNNEPVLTARGRLLGWLTYRQADCTGAAAPRQQWRAFGNEPFWSVSVAPEGIQFDRAGETPLVYAARAAQDSNGRQHWVLDRAGGSARDRLELVITRQACADTMADKTYEYRAEAVFRGHSYSGCAVRGEQ